MGISDAILCFYHMCLLKYRQGLKIIIIIITVTIIVMRIAVMPDLVMRVDILKYQPS